MHTQVDLSDNQLDGSLPSSFPFPHIGELWLQNNNLSGDFIDFLIHWIDIRQGGPESIRVQGNRFTGDVTKLLHSRTLEYLHITGLDFSYNCFNMTPSNDTQLFLNPLQNMLERLCNSSSSPGIPLLGLRELRLAGSDLMGQQLLPTFSCRNPKGQDALQILDLASCNLTGPVPRLAVFNIRMPNLAFLNLSNNRLSGPIPDGLPDTLTILDLASNNLVSEAGIPPKLFTGLRNLVHFNASNNKLSGAIPGTFPPTLQVLDLSHNNLTGEIPGNLFFGLTALTYINLSCNNLSGTIPEGLPPDVFTASSFADNPRLCGGPLPDCVIPQPPRQGAGRINVLLIVTVVVAAVLVSTGSCLLLVWIIMTVVHSDSLQMRLAGGRC